MYNLAKQYKTSLNKLKARLVEAGLDSDVFSKYPSRYNDRGYINLPLEQLIFDFQSGMTIPHLAKKYGVSKDTIRSRLDGAGINPCKFFPNGDKLELPVDQIISEYKAGMSISQLAEWYGVSTSTIRDRLPKTEIRGKGVIPMFPIDQAISEYESGMPIKQIAEKHGVSYTTVRHHILKAGLIEAKKRVKLSMDQVISEYKSGMSTAQIAEKHGVSYSKIKRHLEKSGVKKITTRERKMINKRSLDHV